MSWPDELPGNHQNRLIWLGGMRSAGRRIWYLSCDDQAKAFPGLKLYKRQRKCKGMHLPWDPEDGEVNAWVMQGRSRQNCSLKVVTQDQGSPGGSPGGSWKMAAPFTSWGAKWHYFLPIPGSSAPYSQSPWWHYLWNPGHPISGMSAQFPMALSIFFPVL